MRDLYILEQRGIGWSADFCQDYSLFDPSVSNTPDWGAYQEAALKAMEACFAKAKAARVDLSGYNTIENARDVHALRQALGFDEWNVWGISYGSILGQAYLKEDPQGIRAAVIDAMDRMNIAWGDVRTTAGALDLPTVRHRGTFTTVDDRAGGQRGVTQSPYRFSAADARVRGGAPRQGEHNEDVLADWLGADRALLDRFAPALLPAPGEPAGGGV